MKIETWDRYSERPLIAVSLVFLVAYAWEVIANLQGVAGVIADAIINATWVIFGIDYLVNLALAERRWHWFYTHLFDLAIVALPILRPLRLLRLITLLRILGRSTGARFRGRLIVNVSGAAVLLVFSASVAILDAERGYPGASIKTFSDALWWSVVTLSTVGYGDLYPVSPLGRFLAAAVMVGGVALIGVVTATLASWIVERVAVRDEAEQAATRRQVNDLSEQIALLREALEMDRKNARQPKA